MKIQKKKWGGGVRGGGEESGLGGGCEVFVKIQKKKNWGRGVHGGGGWGVGLGGGVRVEVNEELKFL